MGRGLHRACALDARRRAIPAESRQITQPRGINRSTPFTCVQIGPEERVPEAIAARGDHRSVSRAAEPGPEMSARPTLFSCAFQSGLTPASRTLESPSGPLASGTPLLRPRILHRKVKGVDRFIRCWLLRLQRYARAHRVRPPVQCRRPSYPACGSALGHTPDGRTCFFASQMASGLHPPHNRACWPCSLSSIAPSIKSRTISPGVRRRQCNAGPNVHPMKNLRSVQLGV